MKSSAQTALLIALLLCIVVSGHAQTTYTWKKRVARTIYLTEDVRYAKGKIPDSTLVQMLVWSVYQGKLPGYAATEEDLFSTVMKNEDWFFLSRDKPDTEVVVDPVTRKKITRMKRSGDTDWSHLIKVRVLEDWQFDPIIGSTEIKIIGIGPVRDVYGDNGDFRGEQTLFWVKYDDAKPLIGRYDQRRPQKPLASYVWQSYFSDSSLSPYIGAGIVLTQYCSRLVELNEKSDSSNYLKDYNDYPLSSFFGMFYKRAVDKKLQVYANCCDTIKQVQPRFGDDYIGAVDTVTVVDPITGEEVKRIRLACDPATNTFLIAEKWQMDVKAGRTDIKIISLSPVKKHNKSSGWHSKPSFWLRYADIKKILDRYEQYHPDNTLALHIWNNYFLSDKKPTPIK